LLVDAVAKFPESRENFAPELDDVGACRAAPAAEGLARARALRPAVVLLDIVLPDGSGIDVTRCIVQELRGIDVIAMTFHDDPAYQRSALEAGARAFIVKHRLMNDLYDVLVEIRRRRNARAADES